MMKKIKAKIKVIKVIEGKNILIELKNKIDYLCFIENFLEELGYNIERKKDITFLPNGILWCADKNNSKDGVLVTYSDKNISIEFNLKSGDIGEIIKLSETCFNYRMKDEV